MRSAYVCAAIFATANAYSNTAYPHHFGPSRGPAGPTRGSSGPSRTARPLAFGPTRPASSSGPLGPSRAATPSRVTRPSGISRPTASYRPSGPSRPKSTGSIRSSGATRPRQPSHASQGPSWSSQSHAQYTPHTASPPPPLTHNTPSSSWGRSPVDTHVYEPTTTHRPSLPSDHLSPWDSQPSQDHHHSDQWGSSHQAPIPTPTHAPAYPAYGPASHHEPSYPSGPADPWAP